MMKSSDPQFFEKIHYYYLEFLSRSSQYQSRLEAHHELRCEPVKIVPADIKPEKLRKARKPEEIKKPALFSSGSTKGQIAWDITHKFRCDSNRILLEINIEKPIEIILEQVKDIISKAQKDYWKEQEDVNWFGEYRYLVDYKRIKKGRKFDKKGYPVDLWENCIKAYDYRHQKPQLKYGEIAKILFPKSEFDSAVTMAKYAVKQANMLIKAAEENKFPP